MKSLLKIQTVLLFFSAGMLFAQESNTSQEQNNREIRMETVKSTPGSPALKNAFRLNPNALGFNVKYPMTGGLTYHRWIKKFGIGITAGGIITKNFKYADYNFQLALQGMVFARDIINWFSTALYVNTVIGHRGVAYKSPWYSEKEVSFREFLGVGIGNEFLFAKHISITLECMIVGVYPWELTMGGGGGLKIRF